MKQKIPNLSLRPRAKGDPIYVWQPGPSRRKAGWKGVALKRPDGSHAPERVAVEQARWLNAILAAWSRSDPARMSELAEAWRNGRETRDGGKLLVACPFVEPPAPDMRVFAAPAPIRHVTATDLWTAFRQSKEYRSLSSSTGDIYRGQFRQIIEWLADDPVEKLSAAAVSDYFDLIESPHLASLRYATARRVFAWAIRKGVVTMVNPFLGLELPAPPPRVRVWSEEEIEATLATALKHGKVSLALAIQIALATAQRPVDVCRLGEGHRLDGRGWRGWRIRQKKTGKIVEPVPDPYFVSEDFVDRLHEHHARNLKQVPDLPARIAAMREKLKSYKAYDQVPYLLCENGRPYTTASLGQEWKAFRPIVAKELPSIGGTKDIPAARFQDLRDTAITSMSNRGYSLLQICAQSGHEPAHVGQVLKHYVAMTGDLSSSAIRQLAANPDKPSV